MNASGFGEKWGNVAYCGCRIGSVKCDKVKVRHIALTKRAAIIGHIYTTKIYGVVCPPNISETVAGRHMKLAHRQRIASTTITLIKKITLHFSKNNSANRL